MPLPQFPQQNCTVKKMHKNTAPAFLPYRNQNFNSSLLPPETSNALRKTDFNWCHCLLLLLSILEPRFTPIRVTVTYQKSAFQNNLNKLIRKKKPRTKTHQKKQTNKQKPTKQTKATKTPHHFCIAITGFFFSLTNSSLQKDSAL